MKQVRTSNFYIHDNKKGLSIITNIDVVQSPGLEAHYGEDVHVVLIEYFFEIDGLCFYHNNRRLIVDSWGAMRGVFMTELVDDMFKCSSYDFITKDDVINLVDRMFKNDYGHSTPLMLAAEEGLPNTVH